MEVKRVKPKIEIDSELNVKRKKSIFFKKLKKQILKRLKKHKKHPEVTQLIISHSLHSSVLASNVKFILLSNTCLIIKPHRELPCVVMEVTERAVTEITAQALLFLQLKAPADYEEKCSQKYDTQQEKKRKGTDYTILCMEGQVLGDGHIFGNRGNPV